VGANVSRRRLLRAARSFHARAFAADAAPA